jgi:hypothetical protein
MKMKLKMKLKMKMKLKKMMQMMIVVMSMWSLHLPSTMVIDLYDDDLRCVFQFDKMTMIVTMTMTMM